MAKNQRRYTQEFREQIVELYNTGSKTFTQLESEYGVSRATLHNWIRKHSPVQVSENETITAKEYRTLQKKIRELEMAAFQEKIKSIYMESKKRYGAPKIHKVLEASGIKTSLKRVQRHMEKLGLRSIVNKKYKHHSEKMPVENHENILDRDFKATTINQTFYV